MPATNQYLVIDIEYMSPKVIELTINENCKEGYEFVQLTDKCLVLREPRVVK